MTTEPFAGALILTAAVVPEVRYAVAVDDPKMRLSQYVHAIKYWSKVAADLHYKLCVVETSNFDLLADIQEIDESILFLQFEASAEAKSRGKGAIEADALDAAIRSLSVWLGPRSTVYKVTGRLTLKDSTGVIAGLESHSFRVRRTMDRKFCDSRIFAASFSSWGSWLTGMGADVDDSSHRFLEHVIAKRVIDAEYAGSSVDRFIQRPVLVGQSGTSGEKYGGILQTFSQRALAPIENLAAKHLLTKQI